MKMKFDKDPLVGEQSNHTNKIANTYIIYD